MLKSQLSCAVNPHVGIELAVMGGSYFSANRYYKATLQRFLHTRCTTRSYKAMLPVRSLCYYEPRFHTTIIYFYRLKLSILAQQL